MPSPSGASPPPRPRVDDQLCPQVRRPFSCTPPCAAAATVALVLDRPRAQQHSQWAWPVVSEGRGHEDQVAGRLHQRAIQLGKAQVVADAQAHAQARRLERDRLVAGLEQRGPRRTARARCRSGRGASCRSARRVRRRARRRGWHCIARPRPRRCCSGSVPPTSQSRCSRAASASIAWIGPVARRLGDGELVAVAAAHEAEVLRQDGQFRALARGRARQRGGRVEVASRRGRRDHLQGGDLHRATRPSVSSWSSADRPRRRRRALRPPAFRRTRCARPARPSDRPTGR